MKKKKTQPADKLKKIHKEMNVQKKAKAYLNKKKFKSASNFSTGD